MIQVRIQSIDQTQVSCIIQANHMVVRATAVRWVEQMRFIKVIIQRKLCIIIQGLVIQVQTLVDMAKKISIFESENEA